jgi:hypothetical protein
VPPTLPSDEELNTLIKARLASAGIDLDQLPPGRTRDPNTGSPGQETVLDSLRSFMRATVPALSSYQLPAAEDTDPSIARELSQQPAPMLYPSISVAWRQQ